MATLSSKDIEEEMNGAPNKKPVSRKRNSIRRPGRAERNRQERMEQQTTPAEVSDVQVTPEVEETPTEPVVSADNELIEDIVFETVYEVVDTPQEQPQIQDVFTRRLQEPCPPPPMDKANRFDRIAADPTQTQSTQEQPKMNKTQETPKKTEEAKPVDAPKTGEKTPSMFDTVKAKTLMDTIKSVPDFFTGKDAKVYFDSTKLLDPKEHIMVRHGAILGLFSAIRALLPNKTRLSTSVSSHILTVSDAVTQSTIDFIIGQDGTIVEGQRSLAIDWTGVCSAASLAKRIEKPGRGKAEGLTVDEFTEALSQTIGMILAVQQINQPAGK